MTGPSNPELSRIAKFGLYSIATEVVRKGIPEEAVIEIVKQEIADVRNAKDISEVDKARKVHEEKPDTMWEKGQNP